MLFTLNFGLVKEQKILTDQVKWSLVAIPILPLFTTFCSRKLKPNEKSMVEMRTFNVAEL